MKNHKYIIADHFKAACFIIAEGIMPSGKQRGYILRRLMRKSLSSSMALGIDIQNEMYYTDLVDSVTQIYVGVYDEIMENKHEIVSTYLLEARKFAKAIEIGKKEWRKILKTKISEDSVIYLYPPVDALYNSDQANMEPKIAI